jgi:hypothetical protein
MNEFHSKNPNMYLENTSYEILSNFQHEHQLNCQTVTDFLTKMASCPTLSFLHVHSSLYLHKKNITRAKYKQ